MSFNKRMLSAGAAPFVNSENFKVVTYTGNSSSQAITGVGFQPDFVWIKERDDGTENHNWIDSTRGTGNILTSNNANPEFASGRFTSFDSDGFTLANNNETNDNNVNYVAWCWRANGGTTSTNTDGSINTTVQTNANSSFSIIAWTGNGTAGATIGHNLGATPDMFIVKKRSSGNTNWRTYHKDSHPSAPEDYNLEINGLTPAEDRTEWNDTAPTSSVISLSAHDSVNENSSNYICYAFKSIDGFSKFGSYEGNSSDNGPIVETGFEPAFLIIKNTDDNGSWFMYDNKRNTSNPRKNYLLSNAGNVEASDLNGVNFLSNGFQILEDHDDINDTGDTYIYMAWATDADEEAPALANSFNVEIYGGSKPNEQSITGFGFDPNLIWLKNRDASDHWSIFDTNRGPTALLQVNDSGAEQAFGAGAFNFVTDGFSVANTGQANETNDDLVAYAWQANDNEPTYNTNGSINSIVSVNANAGFSIVSFTGTGSNGTVAHGLSSAPDMIIFKNRDASASWLVYHTGIGNEKAMYLETTGAPTDSNAFFQDTSPTSTVFSVGTHADPNGNTNRIIAYCWHSVTGYSKFGSYTGNGSAGQAITTGFKPDWVLIRSTVGTANWTLYDTRRKRGLNQFMQPNNQDPQEEHVGNANPHVTMTSTGFTFTSDGVSQGGNSNGNLYIYAAFKQNVTSNTTLAKSFGIKTWSGNGSTQSITGLGFRPDLIWFKCRSVATSYVFYDTVRGAISRIFSDSDAAASNSFDGFGSFDSDGWSMTNTGSGGDVNASGRTFVGWAWKAGNTWQHNVDGTIASTVNVNTANGFSIVHWYGTQAAGATVGHGLGAVPEFILVKRIDYAEDWVVYHSALGNTKTLNLNTGDAEVTDAAFNNTTPSSTVFTLSNCASGSCINSNSGNYIAYCWAPKSGYSKFGSYTGNGGTLAITGVGFQPDLVITKRTNSASDWNMSDSVRGTSQGLNPNSVAVEGDQGSNGITTFGTDGFTVVDNSGGGSGVNGSSDTYVYMAFKIN